MVFKSASRETQTLAMLPVELVDTAAHEDDVQKAALRRQMYERIAQGNAAAEAEQNAQRKWRG